MPSRDSEDQPAGQNLFGLAKCWREQTYRTKTQKHDSSSGKLVVFRIEI